MQGSLFKYGPGEANVAFKVANYPRQVVAIGGLTCGFFFCPYVKPLADALEKHEISLVLPLLTSSHQGWGMGSVKRDADELHMLLETLKREYGATGVVMLGHSTGCQDIVYYARSYFESPVAAPVVGAILQGPASDREYLTTLPGTEAKLRKAEAMKAAGEGSEIAFRVYGIDGAAMTADRWVSLAGRGGMDDMFSSDFTDKELENALSALRNFPTLLVMSGDDEYVPEYVDKENLAERMVNAVGKERCRYRIIQGGNHSLKDHEEEAVHVFTEFVQSLKWD